MKLRWLFALTILSLVFSPAAAEDYRAEVLKQQPPKNALSEEVAKVISATGVKVLEGKKTICEIWLRKQWQARPKFSPSATVLYPFTEGDVIGVVHYPDGGSDFRDQQLAAGVYTLRYGLQPEDGNHIGTFDTRDFLMLISAKKDTKLAALDAQTMNDLSAESAKSTHPAMMPLMATVAKVKKLPALRHREESDWWSVRTQSKAKAGEKTMDLQIEFVVVGHADE